MILQNEKIRSEKLYRVGYLPSINKYVMACVVPWISWYDRYFEISEAEYNSFGLEDLDKLATELCNRGNSSPLFLFSDKNEENNEEQRALREKAELT